MYILEANHIKKSFSGVTALSDANLYLKEREVCGLVGANGSGKTTFARIVCGLLKPDAGELKIKGEMINFSSPLHARKFRMALIHQNLSLIPEMTVWENICLGHEETDRLGFIEKNHARLKAKRIIENLVPDLELTEKALNLSPASKQIVEIAKALYREPEILILDEPTASLEYHEVEKLFDIIATLKVEGVSIIFISHRIWEINRVCDRVVAFRDGKTTGILDFSGEERDEKKIVTLITGSAKDLDSTGRTEVSESMDHSVSPEYSLELDNVSVGRKLKSISLQVRQGEVVGLGGLQGQGQQELLLTLFGFLPAMEGTVIIAGERKTMRHPRDAIENGIFLVPGDRQKEGLFLRHTVFSNLIYPRLSVKRHPLVLNTAQLLQECENIIHLISLSPSYPGNIISNLSGGNQQKIVLGKWLSLRPKTLLLDDPTKGVDVQTRTELYNIISELTKRGTSVILYASDNEELCRHCNTVYIMYDGKIVEKLIEKDISKDQILSSSLRHGD
jgi:ribose transport system ATP-binding protein